MSFMKNFVLWIWLFPLNILAFFICGFLNLLCYYGGKYKGKLIMYSEFIFSSFSLGNYIFLLPKAPEDHLRHEYGHCKLSLMLGWLYIPVIAIPSVLHNLYCTIMEKFGKDIPYNNFYTESWAEKLGNKS